MVDNLFLVPLQIFVFGLSRSVCDMVWSAVRSTLVGGYMIQAINSWIQTDIFGPSISQVAFISDGILPMFATIAIWVLAFSYLMSPIMRIRVVDWKKALLWFFLATLMFQYGPGLYTEVEQLRRQFSSSFYQIVFERVDEAEGGIAPLLAINSGPNDVPLDALANQFGGTLPDDTYIDGLDIAMAYTLSGSADVLLAPNSLPTSFEEAFYTAGDDPTWLSYTPFERVEFITTSMLGIFRLLLGEIIVIFGLLEQLIYLCLAISAGVLFIDLMVALPFALFERTELMARSVLDMMLEIFIFSCIVAVFQAIVIGVVTVAAETLNPTLAFGASLIGVALETVLLSRAVKTISDATNRMFSALSQTVGGRVMSPIEALMAGGGMMSAAALSAATAGVGAVGTLAATGSIASAAGSALAGSDKLFNTAALGQMALPEGSQLKEKLTGFYEGALAQRMAPGLGGLLLKEDSKAPQSHIQAEASAEGAREAARQQVASDRLPAGGEQDIRFDAADIVQLREALAAALTAAIRAMPPGGYGSPDQALAAIGTALTSLGRDPHADPAMRAYLSREEKAATSYVMTGHLSLREEARLAGPASQGGSPAPSHNQSSTGAKGKS